MSERGRCTAALVAGVIGFAAAEHSALGGESAIQGVHVAYGIGPGGGASGLELVHNFDAALHFGWTTASRGRSLGSYDEAVLVGPAIATGFGRTPTYVIGEIGVGQSGLFGVGMLLGGVARVAPEGGAGFGLRFAADVFLFQVGARGLVAFGPYTSGQATITLGFGRF